MDISFDGGQHHPVLLYGRLLLHERFEISDRLLHHFGRLQHEGQLNLTLAEQLSNPFHSGNKQPVDYIVRSGVLQQAVEAGDQFGVAAFHHQLLELLLRGPGRFCGRFLQPRALLIREVGNKGMERVLGAAVVDEVQGRLQIIV